MLFSFSLRSKTSNSFSETDQLVLKEFYEHYVTSSEENLLKISCHS